MREARIGSLFTGSGMLDNAVQAVVGGQVAWHAEVMPAAVKVLHHHWPHVPNLGDVSEIDWATVEPIDILTGGFPCTDVSMAGNRKGMGGTRSGLWVHMADAIDVLRPRLVVIENVRGLLSTPAVLREMGCGPTDLGDRTVRYVLRAAGAVLGDLASRGYDANWCVSSAEGIGAPHKRERVFIIAWPSDTDLPRPQGAESTWRRELLARSTFQQELMPTPVTTDAHGARNATRGGDRTNSNDGVTLSDAIRLLPTPRARDVHGGDVNPQGGPCLRTALALLSTPQARDRRGAPTDGFCNGSLPRDVLEIAEGQWGKYAPAILQWSLLTREAPAPSEPDRNGKPRIRPQFSEWMMGWPDGWVTDPALKLSRTDQLVMIGNGVVPLAAERAVRYLLSLPD